MELPSLRDCLIGPFRARRGRTLWRNNDVDVKRLGKSAKLLAIPLRDLQTREIEQLWIKKVRRACIHQGPEHHLSASGVVRFPLVKDLLDLLTLQSVLTAA